MTIQFLQFLFGLSLLVMAGGLLWNAIADHRLGLVKGIAIPILFGWGVWAVFAGIVGALTGNVL
jgi:hypothetical protein